jgi:signal peptidase II
VALALTEKEPVSFARRAALLAVTVIGSIVVDQLTKLMAIDTLKGQPSSSYLGDVFRLTFATNDGAFLSLGATLPDGARFALLTVGVGVVLTAIVIYALRSKVLDAPHVVGYGLIAGGGLSNWFDRARSGGGVVDFMNLGLGPLRTGIFNVADLVILAGIGLVFWAGMRQERAAKAAAEAARAQLPSSAPP